MGDVVVVRPMLALIYTKCPFCNTETWLDRTGTFFPSTKFRCDGCGALFFEELVAIQTLSKAIDQDNFEDNDLTAIMAKELKESLKLASSPTQKITIEKNCFYYAMAACPFCNTSSILRYNAPQPFPAQWCSNESCQAELIITILANNTIGGHLEDWYKKEEDKHE